MPGTYRGRVLARWSAGAILPGSGEIAEAASAGTKSVLLKEVQQEYFQNDSDYSGGDIALNDSLQAIRYARSKKLTKAFRKGVIATVKIGSFIAGAASGATLGSVVPVAGTVAGGALGGVALSTVAAGGTFTLDHMKRKSKGLYKMIVGTRGEHRDQAARALLYCQGCLAANDPKQMAADEALIILLDEEYDEVMAMPLKDSITRLADRMKSN